jgi:hypothetical protein
MGYTRVHLVHCALYVARVSGGHRLQRDLVLAADLDGPDLRASTQPDFDTISCDHFSGVWHQLRRSLPLCASAQHLTSTVRVGRRRVCHVLSQYLAVLPTGLSVCGGSRCGGAATACGHEVYTVIARGGEARVPSQHSPRRVVSLLLVAVP